MPDRSAVVSTVRRKVWQARVAWHAARVEYYRLEGSHWQAMSAGRADARALAEQDAAGCTCGDWRQSPDAPHWPSCPLAPATVTPLIPRQNQRGRP
jgi:hypothetical protein